MTETISCDYCRATIDVSSDTALILSVHRDVDDWEWDDDSWWSGRQNVFRYCNRQHAAMHLERVELPTAESPDEGEDGAFLACSVVSVLLVGALGLWIYGGIQLWHNVVADWF